MEFSLNQQRILKIIATHEFNYAEFSFKNIVEEILKQEFKGLGVQISSNELILYGDNISNDEHRNIINKFFDFYYLLLSLKNEELIHLIEKEIPKVSFSYNKKGGILKKYTLDPNELNELLKLINSNYFISGKLKDLVKRNFKSLEFKNLRITQIALWASIIISLLGIGAQYYIAKNVNTTIEFNNPSDLKNKTNIKGDIN